ncbi:electron transfer flavoprotein subunit beta/FixA family protein [Spiribacter sp. 2438]|uniref:electron transfer flavoprotein subunit beta/FixA family protein n=1 Tax=Spiribacter sp. 2438 TaxID=2666185 RepID=UPI0012B01A3E|nr:electron transfer flavoprotein subunit beta/FixA family protein [Spiribacter sp. 2438]QGM21738.1 electron transfer flavoprotein subunit beta/FixA family protein [Spiribacter sp. 2438]
MKVLVGVKRVVDAYVKIRVRSDGQGVETANTKMSMNPFDEIATEAAVRLLESAIVDEVLAVSVGPDSVQEQLRTCLAMGANRALQVSAEPDLEPLVIARALQAVCQRESPDLVLLGKQAIDDDCNQTGQMLAALQGWAQATSVSGLEVRQDHVRATREIDTGLEQLRLTLPAVISVDLRLNDPRYPRLPDIMKAKRAALETLTLESLGVDPTPRLETLEVTEPPSREPGVRVATVAELVDRLRNEAGVIP